MIKIFEINDDYNIYTLNNTSLLSDILYYVKEDNTGHFYTNNVDGESKIYDLGGGDGDSLSEYILYLTNNYTRTGIFDPYYLNKNKLKYIIIDGERLTSSEIDDLYGSDYGYKNLDVGDHVIQIRIKDASSNSDYGSMFSGREYTKVIIPEAEDYIYWGEFANNNKLEEVVINSNTITKINHDAFYNCNNLKTIQLPSSINEIEYKAFYSAGFEEIELPEGITKIGQLAFSYTKLTSITFPSTITEIGGGVLKNSNKLTSITINATTVPTLNKSKYTDDQGDYYMNDAFDYTNNCSIYVPAASVSAYKAATNWSSYSSKIQAIP